MDVKPVEPVVAVDPQTPPAPPAALTPEKKPKNQYTMIAIGLLAMIPLVYAILNYETFIGMAASVRCQKITRVSINPGEITTTANGTPIEMSALAFDVNNQPVTRAVGYDWGISSDNSVGTIKSRRDLATFYPKNRGSGDLYVQVKNSCTREKVLGSIQVIVQ